jgi:hypothetical protein
MSNDLTTYIVDQKSYNDLKYVAKVIQGRKPLTKDEWDRLSGIFDTLFKRMIWMKVGSINEKDT